MNPREILELISHYLDMVESQVQRMNALPMTSTERTEIYDETLSLLQRLRELSQRGAKG